MQRTEANRRRARMDVLRATLEHVGCDYDEIGADAVSCFVETDVATYAMLILLGEEDTVSCTCLPVDAKPFQNIVKVATTLTAANQRGVPNVPRLVFQLTEVSARIGCCAVFATAQLSEPMLLAVAGATIELADDIRMAMTTQRRSA